MAGQVVGTWRLKVYDLHTADGNVSFPLGPDPVGYVTYTPDGYMFVSMTRRERANLATQSWFGWTVEEKARAATDFVTYCGRYELRDGQIVHHIEMSLLPDWVGTDRTRYAELDGDRLTLTTEPVDSGRTPMHRAVWERATNG